MCKRLILISCLFLLSCESEFTEETSLPEWSSEIGSENPAYNLIENDFDASLNKLKYTSVRAELSLLVLEIPRVRSISSGVLSLYPFGNYCSSPSSYYFDTAGNIILSVDSLNVGTIACYNDLQTSEFIVNTSIFAQFQIYDESDVSIISQTTNNSLIDSAWANADRQSYILKVLFDYSSQLEITKANISNLYPETVIVDNTEGGGYVYKSIHHVSDFNTACDLMVNLITECKLELKERFVSIYDNVSSLTGLEETVFETIYSKTELIMKNLVPVVGAPYFESGEISFVINEWSGTVEFSGGFELPYYTASNGVVTESGYLYALYQ